MEIDWDEEKDSVNRAKHGVGLGDAARLEWDAGKRRRDTRFDYGEVRYGVLVTLDGRLHVCIHTIRNGVYRIISLRKANTREERRYEQTDPE